MKTMKQTLPFLLFIGILALAVSCSSPKKEKEEKKLSPRETVDLFIKNLQKDNLPAAKALSTVGYGEELKIVVLAGERLPSSLYEIIDISMPDEKSAVAKVKIGDDLAEIHLVMLDDGTWLVNKSIGLFDTTIVNASGEVRKYEMTEIEDNSQVHQVKKKINEVKEKVKKEGEELKEEGEELIDEGKELMEEEVDELQKDVQSEKKKLEEKLQDKKEEGQELMDQKQDELQKEAQDEQKRLRKKLESKKDGLLKKKD